MPDDITVLVNGRTLAVPQGATVAAAIVTAGTYCRDSVKGEPRTVLCGMGICFECRAEVDGKPHQRTCQIICVSGMRVSTQDRMSR
ncbi:MAG TPA: 2Fe-2S iron-sulfur cluster-binding protein [Terriglobales bacterium]|jgi:sarcosine oxidase subunit alpha